MADQSHLKLVERRGKNELDTWQRDHPEDRLDLTKAEFINCDLSYFNLSRADLTGAVFRRTKLQHARFEDALLTHSSFIEVDAGHAHFDNADMSDAHLETVSLTSASLSNTTLTNAELKGTNLTGACLDDADLTEVQLDKTTLEGASLRGCNGSGLSFHGNATNANLANAVLNDATLDRANFQKAVLTSASLLRASAMHTQFIRADLSHSILQEMRCKNTHFLGAKLTEVDATNAQFDKADMRDVDFRQSTLTGASFRRSVLGQTDFSSSTLANADFYEARLTATNFSQIKAANQIKHLETTRIEGLEEYFDSCDRNWQERYCDWEHIRVIGNLRLFAISYSLLLFLLSAFYILGIYNEKVSIAQNWAQRVQDMEDVSRPIKSLSEEITGRLSLATIHWTSVALLASTIILIAASTLYTLFCPAEIREFTRAQWCYQLNRSLVHYWAKSWRHRNVRIVCALLYAIGGAGFVLVCGYKLLVAVGYVWQYVVI